jgi:hypothetical protein
MQIFETDGFVRILCQYLTILRVKRLNRKKMDDIHSRELFHFNSSKQSGNYMNHLL